MTDPSPFETSRRRFLQQGAAAAIGATVWDSCRRRSDPPNVLFVSIDDLNDWIGCLGGHPDTRTPHLDRLAADGTLFTNADCAAPVCSPSRTAVLTGREPFHTGVYSNRHNFRRGDPDLVTLPQHFKANGYESLGGGKLFHYPETESWDSFFHPTQVRLGDYRPDDEWGFGWMKNSQFNWGPLDIDESELVDAKTSAWAAEQLARPRDRPFFMAVGLLRPHLPWYLPREYFAGFDPESITLPPYLPNDDRDLPKWATVRRISRKRRRLIAETGQLRYMIAAYLASIAFVDTMLGRVLDALEAGPHAENTLVVLWSDHGFHLGEKGHFTKRVLWERSTHVPLMISAPGLTTPGSRCSTPVGLIHLFPTLCDLCRLELPPSLDGTSLRPLLRNPDAAWSRPALTTRGGDFAVRTDRWRYIRYQDGSEELYDHLHDPNEWYNRADSGPLYDDVKSQLARWIPTETAPPLPESNSP